MNDVIKKLVEIDEKAKSFSEETQKEKRKIEAAIKEDADKAYNKYLEEAKAKAEKKASDLKDKSQKSFEKSEEKRKKSLESLEKKFGANADIWVDEIVSNVIS